MMVVVYVLIYWLVAGLAMLMPKLYSDVDKKLTWKEWVPTFISAPLVFPFCLLKARFRDALPPDVEDEDKPTKKGKKR
jgi:hypothetical protein